MLSCVSVLCVYGTLDEDSLLASASLRVAGCCRDRELELWKAKLDAKADAKVGAGAVAGEGTGELKQPGKVHAITAWCHHPALRVRFSAGQLAALAAGTCSEA